MNRNILRGLFNGDITPWERRDPGNTKVHELVRKIDDDKRYFMEKMSLDDCERFQKLDNLYTALSSSSEEDVFSYGFTLGLLLALDVNEEAKLLFND